MALFPSFAAALNAELRLPTQNPSGEPGRVPLVFSSLARQDPRGFTRGRVTAPVGRPLTQADLDAAARGLEASRPFSQYAATDIVMSLNPNSMSFQHPKRITETKVSGGTAFTHWTDRGGRNNDVLRIAFQGRTGNIDVRGALPVTRNEASRELLRVETYQPPTKAIERTLVWHDLYQLSLEPMLLPDGRRNLMFLTYTSPLLRSTIDFSGHFEQVISFSENGQAPHSPQYDFTFVVTSSEPALHDYYDELVTILEDVESVEDFANQDIPGVDG